MKLHSLLIISVSIATLSGCAVVSSPTTGAIYTKVQGPVAVGDSNRSSKSGQACATNILGVFATGDASIDAAKQSASITQVSTVDHSSSSILGVYAEYCTLVKGE